MGLQKVNFLNDTGYRCPVCWCLAFSWQTLALSAQIMDLIKGRSVIPKTIVMSSAGGYFGASPYVVEIRLRTGCGVDACPFLKLPSCCDGDARILPLPLRSSTGGPPGGWLIRRLGSRPGKEQWASDRGPGYRLLVMSMITGNFRGYGRHPAGPGAHAWLLFLCTGWRRIPL